MNSSGNPRKVAVTGGRGRLAPGLARCLRGERWDVELFSRTSGAGYRAIDELTHPGFLSEFDAVLHLGWSSVPLVAEENPGIEERGDLPFARAMVAAAKNCARSPLLVFFSTAAVYGNTGETASIEDTPCRPLGRYAAAKLEAEKIFSEAPAYSVLRISNVFSPGCEKTRPQGIIPLLLESARTAQTVTIWGDGSAVKDYVAASDLQSAAAAVIARRLAGTFNVSSGQSFSVNQLIGMVEHASGHCVPVRHVPHYSWDVETAFISSDKLQSSSGWKPGTDLVQAIEDLAAAAR